MYRDQKTPYPRGNSATILNYLEELILINAKEQGQFPMAEEAGGYQDLEVSGMEVVQLTVPEFAVSALLIVEADVTAKILHRVIRFKENGALPTENSGFGLGDNDAYTIIGKQNLDQFRCIGIEADKKHFLRIQYYKTAQQQEIR
ncbi:hypothetical protein [Aquimarina agarivorans]|uniref:hypothetical protein n=1 Tax=Aquimarina agarivorans TaxID=980584 RepID=UPI000248FC62|nr:hypothetical protein [Aquimarina agarivorans]